MVTPASQLPESSTRRYLRLSAAPLSGAGGLRARLRTVPPDQRKAPILRPCRALGGDKELAKRHRAGGGAGAAAAQWQRSPMPCHFGVHGGYFAPARRYRAQGCFSRALQARLPRHFCRRSKIGRERVPCCIYWSIGALTEVAIESVRVKTGLFCSISEMFWDFSSLALLAHSVTFVCPPIRRQAPHLWAYECYIMLLQLRN